MQAKLWKSMHAPYTVHVCNLVELCRPQNKLHHIDVMLLSDTVVYEFYVYTNLGRPGLEVYRDSLHIVQIGIIIFIYFNYY